MTFKKTTSVENEFNHTFFNNTSSQVIFLNPLAFLRMLIFVCCLALTFTLSAKPRLDIPPFPANLDLSSVEKLYKSEVFSVGVRQSGKGAFMPCFVFETRNDWVLRDFFTKDKTKDPMRVILGENEIGGMKGNVKTASFTQFSFSETQVEVQVKLHGDNRAHQVTVRPLRHNITAKISEDGQTVSFVLPRPMKVSVEINDRVNPLFLFADTPDTPDKKATYYYGPGIHRLPGDGCLTLQSGQSVYIAAGAILEGRFRLTEGSSNISIKGRGILCNGEWPHTSERVSFLIPHSTFYSGGTSHFTLEGLTLVQGGGWTVAIEDFKGDATHDNVYKNINMVQFAGNTDGFWITGDRNRVENCFIFNNDDAIVSKGGNGSVVSNIVFWGGTWGRFSYMYNLKGRSITNLLVENVDIIGKEGGPTFMLLERKGGPFQLRDVTFRNIRFEDRRCFDNYSRGQLITYSGDDVQCLIQNLNLENFTLDQQMKEEGFMEGSEKYPFNGVTFKNLRMGGKQILSVEDSHIKFNSFVNDLKFLPADSISR